MILFSDLFGSVCLANLFAFLCLCAAPKSLCKIDLYERAINRNKGKKIYVGKWGFFLFTYAEDKTWYPKKTIVLELLAYAFFLMTLAFSVFSLFMTNVIVLEISMGWFMFVMMFCGCLNNMAQNCRNKY